MIESQKSPEIHYRVWVASPEAHLFEIELAIDQPDPNGQIISLPAWIPGSYMIRDFAKNIVTIRATSDGQAVIIKKTNKQTWQCDPCNSSLLIHYQVYAADLSVRGAHLDITHAFFNGTSVFLSVHGQQENIHGVCIEPMLGEDYQSWKIATTLPEIKINADGFGEYQATDYMSLLDHPVEIGHFTRDTFDVNGIHHELVITGKYQADIPRFTRDLVKICQSQIDMFGELPSPKYLFLLTLISKGYGGLEHRNCCSLISDRTDLPRLGDDSLTKEYRQLLGLCSHEYFHLWNVKRIRPLALKNSNLEQETHTGLLWAFEGITSYYDDLTLLRSGCIDETSYLELLAQTITRVYRGKGRHKQTLEESSFDAWTKFYKQDENAPNAVVSYYTKGSLVALALDLRIRLETQGKKSLDDVMRALWTLYGKQDIGVPENGIERLAAEVTGLDLSEFFDEHIRGTQDPALPELLEKFGIEMQLRPAKGADDQGSVVQIKADAETPTNRFGLGVRFATNTHEVKISHVFDEGAAQHVGLSASDIIIAVDTIKATSKNIASLLNRDESLLLHVFRRDELMSFQIHPQPVPNDTCVLIIKNDISDVVIENRKAWLHLGV